MVRIKYKGPGHLLRAAGKEIPRGCEDDLPADVAEQLLAQGIDLDVYADGGPVKRPAAEPPPRVGYGSGRAAWAAYAALIGVPVSNDMNRDQIVAAVGEAAENPEEEKED